MRIIFLMQDTGRVYGAERATMDLIRGLQGEFAVYPHLLLMEETRLGLRKSLLREELDKRGIPYSVGRVGGPVSPALIRSIRAELRDRNADILHAVGYKADLHGGWAARFGRDCPMVSTVHGWLYRPDLKERFYGWLNLKALRRFQRVVCLSNYYQQLLVAEGVPPDRLIRIPSGIPQSDWVEPARAESLFYSDERFTIGIMGRLSFEKNHQMFLHTAHRLIRKGLNARYLIAGDGPERHRIEQYIENEALENDVRLTGYISSEEFMSQVHVLVMCSRIENFPYTLLEAMNWRRPVVATRAGGIPDLVEDGRNGYLVDIDDSAAMADCILSLAADRDEAFKMGLAGRRMLEESFTQERCVGAHVEMYRALIREGS